jgi:hypothetical protein
MLEKEVTLWMSRLNYVCGGIEDILKLKKKDKKLPALKKRSISFAILSNTDNDVTLRYSY